MADRDPSFGRSAKRKRVTRPRPSPKTRTIVGVMSRDECAFPDCLEAIVEEKDNGARYLAGDLCHIYGKEEGSARYDSSRTAEQVNAEENVLFLCRNHHREVDADPERYTVLKLKEWKAAHERRMGPLARERLTDLFTLAVERDLGHLRHARFFQGFDSTAYALGFKNKIHAEYAAAKAAVRVQALAWCARVIADDRLDDAEECLRLAESLVTRKESSVEIAVARAFVCAARSDVSHALKNLDTEASPMALAAALTLLNRDKDAEEALSWFDSTEATLAALDSDGRLVFLMTLQVAGRWERVEAVLSEIQTSDYEEAPALHYVVGLALVAAQTPDDLRPQVLAAVPLNAVNFPLSSTPDAMKKLQGAREHFERAQAIARSLEVMDAATVADDYSLWLRLRDPSLRVDATKTLTQALSVLPDNLRLVPMAIQCSVPFDTDRVEEVIDEQLAAKSKFDTDAAFARLALAFTKEPQDAARYLEKHADELAPFIERTQIAMRRVEILMLAHDYDAARQIVEDLASSDLPRSELERLRSLLEYSKSSDVAALKSQYERTAATADLGRLVMEMQRQSDWDGVSDYGRRLFDRTRSLEDAERLASALINGDKRGDLEVFLRRDDISAMTEVSTALKTIRCWHLFESGRVRECRALLGELPEDGTDPNRDNLRFNLALVTGDWMTIPKMVAEGYEDRATRDVQGLVDMAERSLIFDLPYTKDLVHAIADRGQDDPHAMAAAYWLAMSAEMEDDPTVGRWLRRAVAMSDEHGPMRELDLSDVIAQGKAWQERVSEVSDLLRRGKIPACAVSRILGIPLLDITLRCAIENRATGSGRGRGVVAAYSGTRGCATIGSTKCVGLGPSALMTLSLLGVLEDAIDRMGAVLIPHGTLAWLFVENAAIRFPQPSRLAEARIVAQFRTEGILGTVDTPSDERNGENGVGRDLASLLSAVASGEPGKQHLLVTENPVRTLAGGEMRPVDMSRHYGSIVSPGGVLRAISDRLAVTGEEERQVMAAISAGAPEWPAEPRLTSGSVLYFDALTLGKFVQPRISVHTLLRQVADAGYSVRVSEDTMGGYRGLLRQEEVRRTVLKHVEEMRKVLENGIASGKVRLGDRPRPRTTRDATAEHPELDLVRLAEQGAGVLSGILTDDRYLNQYGGIGADDYGVPVWTTWDWICRERMLEEDGESVFAGRVAVLRRAGFLFVPVADRELERAMMRAEVKHGKLELTSYLTEVQGQIQLIGESRSLQVPEELPWLRTFVGGCTDAVRRVWCESVSEEDAIIRAEWISELFSAFDWTYLPEEAKSQAVDVVVAGYANPLRRHPPALPEAREGRYREWVKRSASAVPRSATRAERAGQEDESER